MGIAIISILLLPQFPATTTWLSKEQRLLGVVRMIEDAGKVDHDIDDDGHNRGELEGLKMAVADPKVWLFMFMLFSIASAAGINAVFPSIVDSLGYSKSSTYLLTAPPWILVIITSLICSWHSD